MKYRHEAQCLVCGHSDTVFHDSKDDYQEVRVCPKCNGAYVDVWKRYKYIKNTDNPLEEQLWDYIKELELLLIASGIQLPSLREDLPTRLEGSD